MNSLPYDQCGYPIGRPEDAYASSICSDVMISSWFGYVSSPHSAATFAISASSRSSRSKSQSAPCEMAAMSVALLPEQLAEHRVDLVALRRPLHREVGRRLGHPLVLGPQRRRVLARARVG